MISKIGFLFSALLFLASCAQPSEEDLAKEKDVSPQGAACEALLPNLSLCASVEWEKNPASNLGSNPDPSSFLLKFNRLDNKNFLADPPYEVAIMLLMPANSYSAPNLQITKAAFGIYRVTNANIAFAGAWEIRVLLKDRTRIIDETVYKFSLK